jgi:hypothetical protein
LTIPRVIELLLDVRALLQSRPLSSCLSSTHGPREINQVLSSKQHPCSVHAIRIGSFQAGHSSANQHRRHLAVSKDYIPMCRETK